MQLLLIVDNICDWARDIFRQAIIRSLRNLAAIEMRNSGIFESEIYSLAGPPFTVRSPEPLPARVGFNSQLLASDQFEQDLLREYDNELGVIRDARYIRSRISGIYVTESTFDLLMLSTNSDEESAELARKVLSLLKLAAFRLEKPTLDAIEASWTGKDRCGSDMLPADRRFLVVTSLAAYLSPDWEQNREIFFLAVDESMIEQLCQRANLGPHDKPEFSTASLVDQNVFIDFFFPIPTPRCARQNASVFC